MLALYDTFNERIISRHRTVRAANAANDRLQKAVKRHNGPTSYIPIVLRRIGKDGDLERFDIDSPEWNEWLFPWTVCS